MSGDRSRSYEMFERARQLVPGGAHIPTRPWVAGHACPLFIAHARGGRCQDVDGNELIDLMMAFGPMILGYADPVVDGAVKSQIDKGTLFTLNNTLQNRLAEALADRVPSAEQVIFVQSGSDATTAAVRIARRFTGRRRIARCGYHGWQDWCLPERDYVPDGLRDQVLTFAAHVPASLALLLDAYPGEVAAVIVAPETVPPPSRDIFVELIDLAHRHGALFILDEIKTGLRTPTTTFQQHVGIRPDLTTLGKALANGYPIAAVVGPRDVMACAEDIYLAGTFHGSTIGMAAALATLGELEQRKTAEQVWTFGTRLIDGLSELARAHRLPACGRAEPLPSMPMFAFTDGDALINERLRERFFSHMLDRGVLVHPTHMWFPCGCHTDADLAQVLATADEAMAETRPVYERLKANPLAPVDASANAIRTASSGVARSPASHRRALLVGCGARAVMHALAYAEIRDASIAAVCDRDETRARQFAERFAIPSVGTDLAELLERQRPDIVHIITPPTARLPLLELAVAAGVPAVIVEKPLANDVLDRARLLRLCEGGTRVIANLQLRFHASAERLIDSVRRGDIGAVRSVQASARLPVAHQGAHLLDLAKACCGGLGAIEAFGCAYDVRLDVDHPGPSSLTGVLHLRNGACLSLSCGGHAPRVMDDARDYRHKQVVVQGTTGYVRWTMHRWEQYTHRGYESGAINYGLEDLRAQARVIQTALDWIDDGVVAPTSAVEALQDFEAVLGVYASSLVNHAVALPLDSGADLLPQLAASAVLSNAMALAAIAPDPARQA